MREMEVGEYATNFAFDDGAAAGSGCRTEFGGAEKRRGRAERRGARAGRQAGAACQRDVSIVGGNRAARGARRFARTFYDFEIADRQLRFASIGQGRLQRVGEKCDSAVRADEVGDAATDLREGDSEGVYEEQGEGVDFLESSIHCGCVSLGGLIVKIKAWSTAAWPCSQVTGHWVFMTAERKSCNPCR